MLSVCLLPFAFDKIHCVRRLATLATDAGTLQAYLRKIAKFPRLGSTEERQLGERIRQGDELALTTLVESNLRFVIWYAKRYRHLGVPFLDLIHEGNWGIIEAARHFAPNGDGAFIGYAAWWIRQSMLQRIAECGRPSSRPTKVSVVALRVELEHQPTSEEIAALLEFSEEETQTLRRASADDDALGGRAWMHGGGPDVELADTLLARTAYEIDDDLTREALVDEVETAMEDLEPKEREVMRLRYGLHDNEPWTIQQVGDRLRISRDRVRHIEARAMQKLRRRKTLRGCLN